MDIPFVDLRIQYQNLKDEIDAAIAAVIDDTAFIGSRKNKYVVAFETHFSRVTGLKNTVGCANGTDAIELVLQALGVGQSDEVIVPACSWISTSEAVSTVGARPVFVDVLPNQYTIDPDLIEEKITPATRAIIPVHLYGLPAEMDAVMDIARRHNLFVIEDCAQAHGARYKGRNIGTFGDAATFSFYPSKNLGAYGDAGAVATDNDDLAESVRRRANHGQTAQKHTHYFEGRNSRLDGLQAAILDVKLKYLEQWVQDRRTAASRFDKALNHKDIQRPVAPDYARHVYHLYVIQVDRREELRTFLKSHGISTAVHYPSPLPFLDCYASYGHRSVDFPVASAQQRRILSLPFFPEMTDEQISFIAERVLEFIG